MTISFENNPGWTGELIDLSVEYITSDNVNAVKTSGFFADGGDHELPANYGQDGKVCIVKAFASDGEVSVIVTDRASGASQIFDDRLTVLPNAKASFITFKGVKWDGESSSPPDNSRAFSLSDKMIPNSTSAAYVGPGVFFTSAQPDGNYYGEGQIFFRIQTFPPEIDFPISLCPIPVRLGSPIVPLDWKGDIIATPMPVKDATWWEQYISLAIGPGAGVRFADNTTGTVAVGYKALNNAAGDCKDSTAIGSKALSQCAQPTNSEAIGNGAMAATTYTDRCTCLGDGAGKWAGCDMPVSNNHDYFQANYPGGGNKFGKYTEYDPCARNCVGPRGWDDETSPTPPTTEGMYPTGTIPGGPSDNYLNVYIGRDTGNHNVKGTHNTFVGGHCAHGWNVSRSTYIGANAGNRALVSSDCVGIGYNCLYANVRGTLNTAGGVQSMESSVFGTCNTAWGYKTLNKLTGYNAPDVTAYNSAEAAAQATNNVAIGHLALASVQYGIDNTALGANALGLLDHDDANTAIGSSALGALETGTGNTATGTRALASLQHNDENTAMGYEALKALTHGTGNVAVGSAALTTLSDPSGANDNTAIGRDALKLLTQGSSNTAVGAAALGSLTENSDNTAMGDGALAALIQGTGNCAFGSGALGVLAAATGSNNDNNTAIGVSALGALNAAAAEATGNVAVGASALSNLLDGDNNTAVGHSAGRYSTVGPPLTGLPHCNNSTALGYYSMVTADNQVQLGNSATMTYVYGTVHNRSDLRDKSDVRDTALGLEFVEALRPVDFRYDYREDYVDDDGTAHPKDGSRTRTRFHHGLIAQEVKAAMDALGVDFGGYQDHGVNGGCDVLTLGYDELIGPLIRSVQELSGTIRQLTARVAELEGVRGGGGNAEDLVPSFDVQPDEMVSLAAQR